MESVVRTNYALEDSIYLIWVRKSYTDSRECARACSKEAPSPPFKTSGMCGRMRTAAFASGVGIITIYL